MLGLQNVSLELLISGVRMKSGKVHVATNHDQFRKSIPGSETHPQYVQPPVIPGHEFIGEVVKLAPGIILCYIDTRHHSAQIKINNIVAWQKYYRKRRH